MLALPEPPPTCPWGPESQFPSFLEEPWDPSPHGMCFLRSFRTCMCSAAALAVRRWRLWVPEARAGVPQMAPHSALWCRGVPPQDARFVFTGQWAPTGTPKEALAAGEGHGSARASSAPGQGSEQRLLKAGSGPASPIPGGCRGLWVMVRWDRGRGSRAGSQPDEEGWVETRWGLRCSAPPS